MRLGSGRDQTGRDVPRRPASSRRSEIWVPALGISLGFTRGFDPRLHANAIFLDSGTQDGYPEDTFEGHRAPRSRGGVGGCFVSSWTPGLTERGC